MHEFVGDRAVVLGGSVTALFAAGVLHRFYREVVLVDRDDLIGVTGPRRGAPQTRHINGLLARGHQIMEEIFPGLTAEMTSDGVPLSDLAGTVRWYFRGKRARQRDGGLSCVAATRPVMESYIRRRVERLPNVVFRERCDIVGLATTAEGDDVLGAHIRERRPDAARETLWADLVVDATGRGSRVPVWLDELGYGRVPEESTKVDLAYATRHYRLSYDPFAGDTSINPVAYADLPRGAIFTKTDSGKVELTVYGLLGDHPPTDPDGFDAFVASLAAPEIHAAIRVAEPLDDVVRYKFPTTMWRRYDRLAKLPAGLIVMGDAVCTPNPVYAQAQTLAALETILLRDHLEQGVRPVAEEFQAGVAAIVQPVWDMASAVDMSFPGVRGRRTLRVRVGHAVTRWVHEAATRDGRVTAAFMTVAGLVDPPEALMRPSFLLRVARALVSRPAGAPAPADRTGPRHEALEPTG